MMLDRDTRHRIGRRLVAGLLPILLLAACSSQPTTPTVTPITISRVTPPAPATATPQPTSQPPTTVAPTSTMTATPITVPSTPTELPTATPTTIPSTPTEPVAPTNAPAPTFNPNQTKLAARQVLSGLDDPVFVTHAGDGSQRLFVVEKPGIIRIVADGKLLPLPLLDISDRVRSSGSEQGLLGLAFSPDFGRTGHFFVNYTGRDGRTVVSRFQIGTDPNQADAASEFKILEIAQPAPNHNGGMLAFGPDGFLWVGTGDGGAANDRFGNGQNPATLLGKMLRLDVSSDPAQPYTIPADNPWVTDSWNGQDVRDEVWAVGLRNPWRYSFDRLNGDLWIADVGQNTYEEVNHVTAEQKGYPNGGLNFGWPIMEGTHCFPAAANCDRAGLVMPVAEYSHTEGGCSITGGYVYRGTQFPMLDGVYLFGDYCSGFIWALHAGADGAWQRNLVLQSGLAISSFGEDEAGELYVTDLSGGLYRLVVE